MQLIDRVRHQAQARRTDGLSGLILASESPDVDVLAVDVERRPPHRCLLVERDAAMLRRCPAMGRMILLLRGARYGAEVRAPIVQLVMVQVVGFKPVSGRKTENLSVHRDGAHPSVAREPLGTPDVAVAIQMPCPPSYERDISDINNGVRDQPPAAVMDGDQRRSVCPDDRLDSRTVAFGRAVPRSRRAVVLHRERPSASNTRHGGSRALGIATCEGAESPAPWPLRPQLTSPDEEIAAARLAGANNARLSLGSARLLAHQDIPPGVAPRAVTSSAGVFACLNCTTHQLEGVA